MEAFARHLPEARPPAWLDLGSGTGRMTPSLASAFGGPVHGVEPSGKMRALAHAAHPAVTGFARIEAALPSLADRPQYETSELLVFQR